MYIAKTVPKDTGFLLGAFTPLAEMLNVKILTVRRGVSLRAGLKKSPGLARLRLERDQALVEIAKRRRVLEAFRRQNQQRQRERDSQAAAGADLQSQGLDAALSKREFIEQKRVAFYQRRLAIASFKKNRQVFLRLKAKIARLQNKIRALKRKRGLPYGQRRESIFTNDVRDRYRTVQIPTTYTQKEKIDALRKKIKLPAFTTQRQKIKMGDADSFRNVYRKRYYPGRGQPRGPIKTPISGRKYATQPQDVFKELEQPPAFIKGAAFTEFGQDGRNITLKNFAGRAKADPTKLTYSFTYDVEIAYYRIMDFLGRYRSGSKTIRPKGTPWFSQRYAGVAFETYLRNNLAKRLPVFTDYIVKSKSTLTKSTFTRGFK